MFLITRMGWSGIHVLRLILLAIKGLMSVIVSIMTGNLLISLLKKMDLSWNRLFMMYGKLKSVDVYGAVGKLAYTRYFEDGSVEDSCFFLYRGGERRDICKKYGKGRSLSLLQTLKGDTIYEKRYHEEKLMSECAIVWNGSHDEESACKSYNRDGSLRDSTINKIKKDFIFRQYFRCDEKGSMFVLLKKNISLRKMENMVMVIWRVIT
jgi:hypothetical protein